MFVMINVHITKEVVETFNFFKQVNLNDNEACGLLIGTHSNDEKNLSIKLITKPGKNDIIKRYSYKIKSKHHIKILKKRFKESNSKEVYLGTWHTHPEDIPKPSIIDVIDWKKQYTKNKHLFDIMIFIIVGKKKILCWSINKTLKIELCNLIYFHEDNKKIDN